MNETAQIMLLVISNIPCGKVATYGQIARLAGKPRNARQVGAVLRDEPGAAEVPWHRVVNAQGRISQRSHRPDCVSEQEERLADEGVEITNGRLHLATYQWDA
ncbi:MGMT family protein [bacterium]|nr:MGMT family protein [bacterium]